MKEEGVDLITSSTALWYINAGLVIIAVAAISLCIAALIARKQHTRRHTVKLQHV